MTKTPILVGTRLSAQSASPWVLRSDTHFSHLRLLQQSNNKLGNISVWEALCGSSAKPSNNPSVSSLVTITVSSAVRIQRVGWHFSYRFWGLFLRLQPSQSSSFLAWPRSPARHLPASSLVSTSGPLSITRHAEHQRWHHWRRAWSWDWDWGWGWGGGQTWGGDWRASDCDCGNSDKIVYQWFSDTRAPVLSQPVPVAPQPQQQGGRARCGGETKQNAPHGTVPAGQLSQQTSKVPILGLHLAGEEQDHHQHHGAPQQVQHLGWVAGQEQDPLTRYENVPRLLLLFRHQLRGVLGDLGLGVDGGERGREWEEIQCHC